MTDRIDKNGPVFVCGLGRSGTTWIAKSLGESPALDYIGEAWLVEKLEELASWFEVLHDEWTGFTPWSRRGVDRRAFAAWLARSYGGLLELAADGRRIVEKTPDWNALHLPFLHELFPDAYFVLVCRDGRNCVASLEAFKAARSEPFDFAESCRRWAAAMDVFSDVAGSGAVKRLFLVRYEDLLRDFDAVFERLCAFTEIAPFRPAPRSPNSAFEAGGPGAFNNRWQSWSPTKRRTFKRHAGQQLAAWGYADEAW